jgi:hypothetical protein
MVGVYTFCMFSAMCGVYRNDYALGVLVTVTSVIVMFQVSGSRLNDRITSQQWQLQHHAARLPGRCLGLLAEFTVTDSVSQRGLRLYFAELMSRRRSFSRVLGRKQISPCMCFGWNHEKHATTSLRVIKAIVFHVIFSQNSPFIVSFLNSQEPVDITGEFSIHH